MKVAIILSLFAMTSATLSQATVVRGIENGDGSWSVNGGVFSFSDDFRSFSIVSNAEILTFDVQRDILNSSFRAFSGQSADEVFLGPTTSDCSLAASHSRRSLVIFLMV